MAAPGAEGVRVTGGLAGEQEGPGLSLAAVTAPATLDVGQPAAARPLWARGAGVERGVLAGRAARCYRLRGQDSRGVGRQLGRITPGPPRTLQGDERGVLGRRQARRHRVGIVWRRSQHVGVGRRQRSANRGDSGRGYLRRPGRAGAGRFLPRHRPDPGDGHSGHAPSDEIAWFPASVEKLVTRLDGAEWVGSRDRHVYLLRLEGLDTGEAAYRHEPEQPTSRATASPDTGAAPE